MEKSVPGDHYTLARNPRYYRFNEGLPYLDKVVFRIVADGDVILKDLQAGTITSAPYLEISNQQAYQRPTGYTLVLDATSNNFEGMFFNFHNTVLASHLEVRQAMAYAIDHQALIDGALHGLATSLCTDHPSALHPGYQPTLLCPVFDPAAANKLLDDNGWAKGPDGVRAKGGQRLEFEFSTWILREGDRFRNDLEAIIQRNLQDIGIKLDIQNYGVATFFGSFLPERQASPPTGAVAGRNDIVEFMQGLGYDPDDEGVVACDQYPSYCNPALDALYKQERETTDPGLRQQLFHQIHHIYLTDFPFIALYFPLDVAVVRKGTHNYQPSPAAGETINIWEWWCDGGKC